MPRERFHVIWSSRAQEGTYNLFARLPRQTAQRLAAKEVIDTKPNTFIPLALSFEEHGEHAFVSFNGGFIEVFEHDSNVIELPRQLFKDQETKTHVWVESIPMPQTAEEIHVEPLHWRDWEMMETWSSQLEDLLLQQVTVVYPGQSLPLQVSSGIIARVCIKASGFKAAESTWEDETLFQETPPCLCLKSNTSVVVLPKPRPSIREPLLRLVPCMQDYNESMERFAEAVNVPVLHVPPFSVVVHPDTLTRLAGYSQHMAEYSVTLQFDGEARLSRKEKAIARIITNDIVPKNAVAMHPLVRLKMQARVFVDQVVVRILNESEITVINEENHENARLSLCPIRIVGNRNSTRSIWRQPDLLLEIDKKPVADKNTGASIPAESRLHFIDTGGYIALPLAATHTCRQTLFRVDCTDCEAVVQVGCLARLIQNELCTETKPEVIRPDSAGYLINTLPDISIIHDDFCETAKETFGRRGLVIHGQVGDGKTHIALMHATFARLKEGYSTVFLDCRKLRETRDISIRDILQEITQLFEDATKVPSCTVILDNLDQIIPSIDANSVTNESARSQQINPATAQQSKLLNDALVYAIDCARLRGELHVVVTCESPESIPTELFKVISGENAAPVSKLSSRQHEDLFTQIILSRNIEVSCQRWSCVSRITEDYRARDIRQLAFRVAKKLGGESPIAFPKLSEMVENEVANFVPISQASASVESKDLSRSWEDVGGLFKTKRKLLETIIRPSIYRRIYENSKVRQPKGILLFGPPGNGKSFIVPALAKECGYRMITCRGPELLDKYIGASEANVRNLFARAASVAPSILFLDELDALAPRRGSDHTGVTDRIVNQLLTFLDGVEDVSGGKVYVLAATSRPDKVDPALLRPGRLETHIYVGYPSPQETKDIVSKIAQRYSLTEDANEMIRIGNFVSQSTEAAFSRLSPADIKGAFDRAHVSAVHEAVESGLTTDEINISSGALLKALKSCQPSLPQEEYERQMSYYSPFTREDSMGLPTGNRIAIDGSRSERKQLRTALK